MAMVRWISTEVGNLLASILLIVFVRGSPNQYPFNLVDLVSRNNIASLESSNSKTGSDLVADADPGTCSRITSAREKDPRWIQLHFKHQHLIKSIVVTINESQQKFSLFVIEQFPNNRTKFTRCDSYSSDTGFNKVTNRTINKRLSFSCPGDGLIGNRVFIRDDNQEGKQFSLCEIEVFGISAVTLKTKCSSLPDFKNGDVEFVEKESALYYVCHEGYALWGRAFITCRSQKWSAPQPSCQPLTCMIPEKEKSENSVFKLEKNRTRVNVGDQGVFLCEDGYLLLTNSSEGFIVVNKISAVCSTKGSWEVEKSFSCVNSSLVTILRTWSESSSFSAVHTVFIVLCLILLLLIVLMTIFLYKRNAAKIKKVSDETKPDMKTSSLLPLSRNSDRDTSTTTIYDEDIQIPDSGSLIRGPLVDDVSSSIFRGDCLTNRRVNEETMHRPKILITFKPDTETKPKVIHHNDASPTNLSNSLAQATDHKPTRYCVAWTDQHLVATAAFPPSEGSLTEDSSITCLPEESKDQTTPIYANIPESHHGYAALVKQPKLRGTEVIYANDAVILKNEGRMTPKEDLAYAHIIRKTK